MRELTGEIRSLGEAHHLWGARGLGRLLSTRAMAAEQLSRTMALPHALKPTRVDQERSASRGFGCLLHPDVEVLVPVVIHPVVRRDP